MLHLIIILQINTVALTYSPLKTTNRPERLEELRRKYIWDRVGGWKVENIVGGGGGVEWGVAEGGGGNTHQILMNL